MEHRENYGLVKGVFAAIILVYCAAFINTLLKSVVYVAYHFIILNDSYSVWIVVALVGVHKAVIPALCEETMRYISCRKGVCTMIAFPLVISFAEHLLTYSGEPLSHLFVRLWSHGLLTAIQYIGVGEDKKKLFFWIAVCLHFCNNFSNVLRTI